MEDFLPLVMALLASLFLREQEKLRRTRAVRVVAHAATCKLVRLMAVRLHELLLGVAILASAAEPKPAPAAHAVAERAFRRDRRVIHVGLAGIAIGGVPGVDHALVNAIG